MFYLPILASSTHAFLIISVNTISLAKPEKGRMVENMLLNMARTGQLAAKVILV